MDVTLLPDFNKGDVSVQDAAAQLAAPLLDPQPGDRVLDACAAPGGKTSHLLEYQENISELIALDIDTNRLEKINENLNRLKQHAKCITGDAADIKSWWDGQYFDRILLDAPCSATGVIRRHPDIKILRHKDDILPLLRLQQAILDALWHTLVSGGFLLYATCSILKEENTKQIESFLSRHPDAIHHAIDAQWGVEMPAGRQILPGENNMDGFFYARIQKA
jgi:16S rRNA (cytosine967-C5)-methyltransferase